MGSPRQRRALAAAAAGQARTRALAQRQPSPLGGAGVAVWGSADAERFLFALISTGCGGYARLARGYQAGRR